MKNNTQHIKVFSYSALVTAMLCAAQPTTVYASDIEIYREAKEGKATIMLMLDKSGSMNPDSNVFNEDRIGALKQGLKDVLSSDDVADSVFMGLSVFSGNNGYVVVPARGLGEPNVATKSLTYPNWYRKGTSTSNYRYSTCNNEWNADYTVCTKWGTETPTNPGVSATYTTTTCDGVSCRLYTTTGNKPLNQRGLLLREAASIVASGGTPTPYAYAEAAAYLMGETTGKTVQSFIGR
jgi:type IV pilus assembly protein PilY1